MRQARTRNTINLNTPPLKRPTPPPIPPRPLFRLGSLTSKPLPSPPSSPESELCGSDCVLCIMRVSVSPESTIVSPATAPGSTPSAGSALPTRKPSNASTSRASRSSVEPFSPTGKKQRIRAKAHLEPSPDSNDIVLSLDDLPAWTIGFPPHRRVKEAIRVSLSCGGIEVESEADISGLRHDSGLDFGEDPRLSDLMWGTGCHFTFHFWYVCWLRDSEDVLTPRTRTPLRLPEHKPRRSSRRPSTCTTPTSPQEQREEQRIARQNDPEHIRKQRLLRRLNPLKQTETFNALTIMAREGLPDGFGGVYTKQDLEYIRDKMIKFAPLQWKTQEWYRNGVREMGIDPDSCPKSPVKPEGHGPTSPRHHGTDASINHASAKAEFSAQKQFGEDGGHRAKPRPAVPAITTRLTS